MRKMIFIIGLIGIVLNCQQEKTAETQLVSPVVRHFALYRSAQEYCAWPSIARTSNGDLIVAFCRTEEHLSPNGTIVLIRSRNNGKDWEEPEIIYDTPLDDRESGFTLLENGQIMAHYYSLRHTKEKYENLPADAYEQSMLDRWIQYVEQPEYKNAREFEGSWCAISDTDGHTWSLPLKGPDSIHGGIQLKDGPILVAPYRAFKGKIAVVQAESPDHPWEQLALIESPQPDSLRFGEPHLLQLPSGRIIMMIRATAIPYDDLSPRCFLWETYSDDNGKTWVPPFKTELWGYPPHLLLLSDGRVVCTYGYRRPPFGQRACVSEDGITWKLENEIVLRDDAYNKDLGYPASVELEPGKVLSIYYQPDPTDGPQKMHPPDPNRSKPDIWGTVWKVPARKKGEQ